MDFDIKAANNYAFENRREIDKGIVSFWGLEDIDKRLGKERFARMSDEYKEYIGVNNAILS